jgi:predicted RNA-binding Zn-ribbon protein involved in translation (DUF1610 family)
MSKLFKAIEGFFIAVFSFLFISLIAVASALPIDEGGLGFAGIIAFLIWLFLMLIFIKVSRPGAAILGIVAFFAIRLVKVGTDGISQSLTNNQESIEMIIGIPIMLFIFYKIFLGGSSGKAGKTTGKISGHVCPRCGSQLLAVPARSVPTGRYEVRDGEGRWEYDYSTSQTKSTWVVPKIQVPEYETVPAHYECPNCGYSSR